MENSTDFLVKHLQHEENDFTIATKSFKEFLTEPDIRKYSFGQKIAIGNNDTDFYLQSVKFSYSDFANNIYQLSEEKKEISELDQLLNQIDLLKSMNKLHFSGRKICSQFKEIMLYPKTSEYYWHFSKYEIDLFGYLRIYYKYTKDIQEIYNFLAFIETKLNENFSTIIGAGILCYNIKMQNILLNLDPFEIVLHDFNFILCTIRNETNKQDSELLIFWYKLLLCVQNLEIVRKIRLDLNSFLFFDYLQQNQQLFIQFIDATMNNTTPMLR